ncbi:MAG: DUF5107 domain-containing protein [Chloroflexi bacterium]|nr:DUF5107 domain-containing protein [Chloroflexota bacterium]MBP7044146.1 DUF5107 domain-containing protein [Chloroflexota bacterium]
MKRIALTLGLFLAILTSAGLLLAQWETRPFGELTPRAYLPMVEYVPAPTPPPPGAPTIITGTLTINAYQYDHPDCQIATLPGDFVYPYPRLNHDCVFQKPIVARQFQAITLENDYTAVTVLPELGGRLYRWLDKTTGRQLFYNNPVLKPTAWGHRGWWLATGGIEWDFPTDEHGLNEYRPWVAATAVSTDTAAITLSDLEDQTGMTVGVTLTLEAAHSYLTIEPWVENQTASAHNYQYWLNAMIALDNNQATDAVEFILPANEIVIHSTGDPQIPGEHSVISWPEYNGRFLNLYNTWNGWIGFFAPNILAGYSGIYDHAVDQGLLRVMDTAVIPGHKFFGPATLGSGLWTDDNSTYVEMWSSGVTADFWTYTSLAAGQTAHWTEHWYAVSGINGFSAANESGALRLAETWQGVEMEVAVTAVISGTIQLYVNGSLADQWPVELVPGPAWVMLGQRPSGASGPLGLRLVAGNGITLIATGVTP